MKVSTIFVFAALLAAANAAPGFIEYRIFTESTCAEANMIGLISDVVADVTSCVGAFCEQIGTSGQYRNTACLSARNDPPTNYIQWNFFGDNACTTATNYSAIIPNTCVQVRDQAAVKFQPCSSGSFDQVQANTVSECNGGTNIGTLTVDTSKCVDLGDGKSFTKGVCAASNTPSAAPTTGNTPTAGTTPSAGTPVKAPAKANSAVTTVVSAVALSASFLLAF